MGYCTSKTSKLFEMGLNMRITTMLALTLSLVACASNPVLDANIGDPGPLANMVLRGEVKPNVRLNGGYKTNFLPLCLLITYGRQDARAAVNKLLNEGADLNINCRDEYAGLSPDYPLDVLMRELAESVALPNPWWGGRPRPPAIHRPYFEELADRLIDQGALLAGDKRVSKSEFRQLVDEQTQKHNDHMRWLQESYDKQIASNKAFVSGVASVAQVAVGVYAAKELAKSAPVQAAAGVKMPMPSSGTSNASRSPANEANSTSSAMPSPTLSAAASRQAPQNASARSGDSRDKPGGTAAPSSSRDLPESTGASPTASAAAGPLSAAVTPTGPQRIRLTGTLYVVHHTELTNSRSDRNNFTLVGQIQPVEWSYEFTWRSPQTPPPSGRTNLLPYPVKDKFLKEMRVKFWDHLRSNYNMCAEGSVGPEGCLLRDANIHQIGNSLSEVQNALNAYVARQTRPVKYEKVMAYPPTVSVSE
jgi:hypothetical protein